MVAGRADRNEHRSEVRAGGIDGGQPGPGGQPGIRPRRRPGIGVLIDGSAAGGAELLELLEVGRSMDPDQALGRGRF